MRLTILPAWDSMNEFPVTMSLPVNPERKLAVLLEDLFDPGELLRITNYLDKTLYNELVGRDLGVSALAAEVARMAAQRGLVDGLLSHLYEQRPKQRQRIDEVAQHQNSVQQSATLQSTPSLHSAQSIGSGRFTTNFPKMSVARVRYLDGKGQGSKPLGSGVFLAPNLVLTCLHVVAHALDQADILLVRAVDSPDFASRVITIYHLNEVIAHGAIIDPLPDRHDIAVLELERPITDATLLAWDQSSLDESTEVYNAGYRNSEPDKAMELVESTVSRYDGQHGVWELRDVPAVGFSGGPVVRQHNGMWRLVGLLASRIDYQSGEPRHGCLIPAVAVQQVLARLGQAWPLAEEFDGDQTAPSTDQQAGKRTRFARREAMRVFLSYSHDSPVHRSRVLALVERLRRDGVDAWLDRYTPNPSEGWPRWMQRQIEQADFVLLVCTAIFRRRFDGREEPGKGRGVTWEGLLAAQVLYESGTLNHKLIPVLFEDGEESDIPLPLRPYTYYRLPVHYDQLYRHLIGQPEIVPPELGSLRELTPQSDGIPDSGERPLSPFLPGVIIERAEDFVGRRSQLDEIRNALHHRQPVQILGEAGMGKSSLLIQVAQGLVPADMPVARVHARGRSGWSPRELILAAADALDRRPAVEQMLVGPAHGEDEAPVVMAALQSLMPCALLLDDADAIANTGHRFERAFFDQCRALTQSRKLLWISASRRDLEILFSETGLTSEFLNDSKRVVVGHLEEQEVGELLAVIGRELASRSYTLAAGWPLGLQWLGDKLWLGGDTGAIDDDFANAMEQSFRAWWKLRTNTERSLLRRLLVPTPNSDLSRPERRRARKLASRGLLTEQNGVFSLPGTAWKDWLCDVE